MSPQVGVGVLIFREGKILLGRRKGSHGAGDWATPGGHLEYAETPENCARRETLEETAIDTGEPIAGPYVSTVFPKIGRHYITLFMLSQRSSGQPTLMEPEKCAGWHWFSTDALPEPLFAPLKTLIDQWGVDQLKAWASAEEFNQAE